MKRKLFCQLLKEARMKTGKTLREFCLENKIDPGNWSKLERGRLAPPKGEKLDEYLEMLKIPPEERFSFCDIAYAEAGEIPPELLGEELISKLPLFFRTIRNEKKDGMDLDQIIDLVKKS